MVSTNTTKVAKTLKETISEERVFAAYNEVAAGEYRMFHRHSAIMRSARPLAPAPIFRLSLQL